jgi:hypothetical protein
MAGGSGAAGTRQSPHAVPTSRRLSMTAQGRDVPRRRARHRRPGILLHDPPPPRAIETVERVRRDHVRDALHRGSRQRDQVGVAVHEADVAAILHDLEDVPAQQGAAPLGARRPVQHRATREMASAVQQREPIPQLSGPALPEGEGGVGPHHPRSVGGVQIDGGGEGPRPLHHAGVVVGMRDGDGGDPPSVGGACAPRSAAWPSAASA